MRDRTSWPVVGVPINAPIESLPIGGWRSLAARTVRDREAPGSNPGPPTISYSKSTISKVVELPWV